MSVGTSISPTTTPHTTLHSANLLFPPHPRRPAHDMTRPSYTSPLPFPPPRAPKTTTQDVPSTHNLDQPRLPRDVLGAPSKVASVETDGTVLGVTATGADLVDALR